MKLRRPLGTRQRILAKVALMFLVGCGQTWEGVYPNRNNLSSHIAT